MRMLRALVVAAAALTTISYAQTDVQPGPVSGTWNVSGSPYLIHGDLTVQFGDTLTIDPGVIVEFQGHYRLNVAGRLLALGTETDTITFTIHDTSGFSNREDGAGGWHGIRFSPRYGSYDSSKIIYCKLEYGKALGPNWPDEDGGAICVESYDRLLISHCLIRYSMARGAGGGMSLIRCSPKIAHCTISFNTSLYGGGIKCYEAGALIEDNTVTDNTAESGGGIFSDQLPGPDIVNTSIARNQAKFGGGIGCYESNPRLIGVTLLDNSAEGGAGMLCNGHSNPTITDGVIEGNAAQAGGGIVCWESSPILDSVTFHKNTAEWEGGGISAYNSNVEITRCQFSENDANGIGGAVVFRADTSEQGVPHRITVDRTRFLNNSAGESGAVTVFNFAYTPLNVDVIIEGCEFTGNASDRYSALSVWDCRMSIANSIFIGNEATDVAGAAGFRLGSSGTVSNCVFSGNGAQDSHSGGAMVWSWADVHFTNCTFAENAAAYGAGLTVGSGGIAAITNCIFWGNGPNSIALDTLNGLGGVLTANYCDVQGGEDSVTVVSNLSALNWGNGNINANPLFVDPLSRDYHLSVSSPCIGAGVDSVEIGGIWHCCPPADMEGHSRPNPPGSNPDMGACESSLANPAVGIEQVTIRPTEYALRQNYPNPFNPSTVISYQLPAVSEVRLVVYDLLGRDVAVLVNGKKAPGNHEVRFDASGLASGVYLYRLTTVDFARTRTCLLVR